MADSTVGGNAQLDALPPLRPAACFCLRFPPLPLPLLPDFLPPFFDAWLSEPAFAFEIAAARPLLMPFLRRPSYCLSFLTLDPWSFAMVSASFAPELPSAVPTYSAFAGKASVLRR